ncbi:cold shock protein (beta-ribbon, CspA family) [Cetobacterium ceti]|uniref:Cold shock protein (Beta-ribbon, CspA family) n=1 Tax=Cetobacterium ceti TaxID=180163 RepID=A0A1T4N5P8_9FUSO|nr:cold shock domain-containing protein [Cetobacterium ceti]SJZ74451.1 cold shock protein (beta-ribbon, CspA family) [Cetobacterium ceti]
MKQGIVKWFNKDKGYGFITGEDKNDYFIHYSGIEGTGFKNLKEGEEVTFDIKETPKGIVAIGVIRK